MNLAIKLERVTLTGVDDATDLPRLSALSAEFPIVEWGVLFHADHLGQGRYPSLRRIEELCTKMRGFAATQFALHICGRSALTDFVTGTGFLSEIAVNFERIQLNLKVDDFDLALLTGAINRYPQKTVITQHNQVNAELSTQLENLDNHALLFDESGGKGVSPTNWPERIEGKRCGYAGGLGPMNLAIELPRIAKAAGECPYWIDMEGKLRNGNDCFDLALARQCLEICVSNK